MKNQPLTIFLFVCLLASYGFFTCAHAQTSLVTAGEYCDFLNQNAASDPDNLFDEKMEANPETGCIVRLGTPGNFEYEVIAGRENFPVMYVNDLGKEKYCAAIGTSGAAVNTTAEDLIKSNRDDFSVLIDSASSLQMFSEPVVAAAGASWDEAVAFLTALGVLWFGDAAGSPYGERRFGEEASQATELETPEIRLSSPHEIEQRVDIEPSAPPLLPTDGAQLRTAYETEYDSPLSRMIRLGITTKKLARLDKIESFAAIAPIDIQEKIGRILQSHVFQIGTVEEEQSAVEKISALMIETLRTSPPEIIQRSRTVANDAGEVARANNKRTKKTKWNLTSDRKISAENHDPHENPTPSAPPHEAVFSNLHAVAVTLVDDDNLHQNAIPSALLQRLVMGHEVMNATMREALHLSIREATKIIDEAGSKTREAEAVKRREELKPFDSGKKAAPKYNLLIANCEVSLAEANKAIVEKTLQRHETSFSGMNHDTCLEQTVSFLNEARNQFATAIQRFTAALAARTERSHRPLAHFWSEAGLLYQQTAHHYLQAVESLSTGLDKSQFFIDAAAASQLKADQLTQAIKDLNSIPGFEKATDHDTVAVFLESNAKEVELNARSTLDIAERLVPLAPDDLMFESVWIAAKEKTVAIQEAYSRRVQFNQLLRGIVKDPIAWEVNVLHPSLYDEADWKSKVFRCDVEKAEKVAQAAWEQAEQIMPEDFLDFELAWTNFQTKADEALKAWNHLLEYNQQLRNFLPDQREKTRWDQNILDSTKYHQASSADRLHECHTEKAEKIAKQAQKKAEEFTPDNPEFQSTWENAIKKGFETAETWKQRVDINQQLRKNLPINLQTAWDRNILLPHQAQQAKWSDLVRLWSQATSHSQTAANYRMQATQADADGNPEEAKRFNNAANSVLVAINNLAYAAELIKKAAASKISGNQEVAFILSQAASHSQSVANYYIKKAQANAAGNSKEVWRLYKAAYSAESAVNNLADALELTEKANASKIASNQEVAFILSQAASHSQTAADYHMQEAHVYETDNDKEPQRLKYLASSAESVAQNLTYAAELTEKSDAAKIAGNQKVVDLWSQAASCLQTAANNYIQDAQLDPYDSRSHQYFLASSGFKIAECLVYAAEISKKNTAANAPENQEVASLLNQAVRGSQTAVEYYRQADQACAAGKKEKIFSLTHAACDTASRVKSLTHAVELAEKIATLKTSGNQEVADDLLNKIVSYSQTTANYYLQLVKKYVPLIDNGSSAAHLRNTLIKPALETTKNLADAVELIEKATLARAADNQEAANLWSKAARHSQAAADYRIQAAQAYEAGNKEDVERLSVAAASHEGAAENLVNANEQTEKAAAAKAALANAAGNQEVADLWSEAVRRFQIAGNYYMQSTQSSGRIFTGRYSLENIATYLADKAKLIANVAESLADTAKLTEKTTAAKAAGHQKAADLWSQAASHSQAAADYNMQVAQAEAPENYFNFQRVHSLKTAATSAKCTSKNLAYAVELIEKATVARATGNLEAAYFWNEAASHSQTAADYRIQEAQAKAAGIYQVADLLNAVTLAESAAEKCAQRAASKM